MTTKTLLHSPILSEACLGVLMLAFFMWGVCVAWRWTGNMRRKAKEGDRNLHRFLTLAACTEDAIIILRTLRSASGEIADFCVVFLNERAQELTDASVAELPEARIRALLSGPKCEGVISELCDVVLSGRPRVEVVAIDHPLVRAKWLRVSAARFEDGLMLSVTDLTEQKRFEHELCQIAFHDPLTKLPNRALLDDRIQQVIERAKRHRTTAAVLIVDIDDFKQINDEHGHAAGDVVLQTVASRLRDAVRGSDSVFRLGGDEFVIVFADIDPEGPAVDFARKVTVNLLAPVVWSGHRFMITASTGVAMYPAAGTTPETLLVQADIEMYRMKRSRVQRMQSPKPVRSSGAQRNSPLRLL